jgi:hypothetical protein
MTVKVAIDVVVPLGGDAPVWERRSATAGARQKPGRMRVTAVQFLWSSSRTDPEVYFIGPMITQTDNDGPKKTDRIYYAGEEDPPLPTWAVDARVMAVRELMRLACGESAKASLPDVRLSPPAA